MRAEHARKITNESVREGFLHRIIDEATEGIRGAASKGSYRHCPDIDGLRPSEKEAFRKHFRDLGYHEDRNMHDRLVLVWDQEPRE